MAGAIEVMGVYVNMLGIHVYTPAYWILSMAAQCLIVSTLFSVATMHDSGVESCEFDSQKGPHWCQENHSTIMYF